MRTADEASSATIESRPQKISLARLIWAAPAALTLAATAIYGGLHFPVASIPLVLSLVFYAGLLWRQPQLWLFFVPALLPILNLAPWSGRFFFDEFDLFLLATVAIWVLRSDSQRPLRFAPAAATLITLFVFAFAASLALGLLPLGPVDANAFASYFSKYNGLRVGKGLLWGVVLVYLARSDLARHEDALNRYWVPGMLVGLAGVVVVALWERIAFPGLMNFAEEYRITSTFGSMHVGGAAIDGYLALAIPFTLAWMAGTRSPFKLAARGRTVRARNLHDNRDVFARPVPGLFSDDRNVRHRYDDAPEGHRYIQHWPRRCGSRHRACAFGFVFSACLPPADTAPWRPSSVFWGWHFSSAARQKNPAVSLRCYWRRCCC